MSDRAVSVEERCPHCTHRVSGSPWWVRQQMDIHLDYGHRDDDDDRPGTDMSDEFPTGEYPALADTGYHMVRMVRMVPMVPAIMNPRRNEYADLPTRDAMKALVGVWHDMNEAGCCDSDGPPFCPESKAYAHGYLAALAAEGY